MATQPLFGLVPAGHPLTVTPTTTLSPTSFLYTLPSPQDPPIQQQQQQPQQQQQQQFRPFSHVVVFLLPGINLPPDTAAAIYLVTPGPAGAGPNSRFLGGVGPGKESAIFKLGSSGSAGSATSSEVAIGISIEPAGSVAARIAELSSSSSSAQSPSTAANSMALVPTAQTQTSNTLVLAQRIIRNAFNFLAGFSGTAGAGAGQVEVVPLRAFEEWWRKFESKLRTEPGFLEREEN